MKPTFLILTAAALLVAGAAAARPHAAATSSNAVRQHPVVLYGHVKSVVRSGKRYQMRFDPAWWLTGVAAEHACGCKPVPNDYYIVDESHRLLTFVVRRDAHVTVLVRRGAGPIPRASISVAELAQIVRGRKPQLRRLLEPMAGFWSQIGET
jgi:hypothetical protein